MTETGVGAKVATLVEREMSERESEVAPAGQAVTVGAHDVMVKVLVL